MKKQLLSLSVASAIALAGAMPAYAEDEECDGVLVQSRFALANCMVESAVAIAAAAATENGCQAGEWDLVVDVPETNFRLIPLQGAATISNGSGDFVELSGQSSALAQNNINCRVETNSTGNVFDGKELVYSPGFNNFYVDAIINRDEYVLCITESVSSGDIVLDGVKFDETNNLTFAEEDDAIVAEGLVIIGESQGGGGGGSGQGSGGPDPDDLSIWEIDEAVVMPAVGETVEEGFDLEAETDDIGKCKIEVEAAIVDTQSSVNPAVSIDLAILGTLSVEVVEDDD
ncbi:MAG: hypothetical protein ABFR65_00340 [Pseudomonadota bacterium]